MSAAAAVALPRPKLRAFERVLYEDLWHLRRAHRKVVPSTAKLAERHGKSRSTIKRTLSALRAAGLLVSVYNGGRGRRCIYYLGERAAQRVVTESPQWPEISRFGGLRMGKVVMAQRQRKDLKNEILKPSGSSSTERGTASQSPPSENQGAATSVADRDAPPQSPPMGGPMQSAPSAPAPAATHPPQQSCVPPQSAASGRQLPKGERKTLGGKMSRRTNSIAKKRPDMWSRAWWLWRSYIARARGGGPKDHVSDVGAMKSLLSAALLRAKGDDERALDHLAYWFRCYVADDEHAFKPLGKLSRLEPGARYGDTPERFQAPHRREDATVRPDKATAAAVRKLAGVVGAGGRGNSAEIPRKASPTRRAFTPEEIAAMFERPNDSINSAPTLDRRSVAPIRSSEYEPLTKSSPASPAIGKLRRYVDFLEDNLRRGTFRNEDKRAWTVDELNKTRRQLEALERGEDEGGGKEPTQ